MICVFAGGSQSIFTAMGWGAECLNRSGNGQTYPVWVWRGLTVPGFGDPLPVELFMHEMTRLECDFTFLSVYLFFRDTIGKKPQDEIPRIVSAVLSSMLRDETSVKLDKKILTDKAGSYFRSPRMTNIFKRKKSGCHRGKWFYRCPSCYCHGNWKVPRCFRPGTQAIRSLQIRVDET